MTKTRWLSVAAILCGLLGCPPALAAPITTGRQVIDINGTPMVVFTYRPAGCSDPALLLVFHGIARNARACRDDARVPAGGRAGVRQTRLSHLALPARRHRQGGRGAGCARMERHAGARSRRLGQEGRPLAYFLLGHSAGAQFLDRLAAFVPTEATRI